MTGIRNIFLIFIFLSTACFAADSLSVQNMTQHQIKKFAKNSVTQGDDNAAIFYYEKYLKTARSDYKSAFALGASYQNVRDYKNAENWYKTSFDRSKETYTISLFYYALMLKMNGDYKTASKLFQRFKKESSGDSKLKILAKHAKEQIAGCDSAYSILQHPSKTLIFHMDSSVNKVNVESAPLALNDSTIIYSSLRTNKKEYYVSSDTANNPSRKFYEAKKVKGEWKYNGEYPGPFNEQGVNVGNGSFSQDGKRFYFTKCNKNWKNKMICAIYVSTLENGTWQEPKILSPNVNNPKYTSSQPTTGIESKNKNEVVYFVSDRPGGKGGMDIWYTIYDLKKKTYKDPRNAGTKVNTEMDEITPYYDNDKRILFFSSNGHAGIGGLDIMSARGELSKWLPAVNIGAPINSSVDDLYYSESTNKEEGFFVSNRKGGVALKSPTCCDDLYSFKKLEYVNIKAKVNVTECQKELSETHTPGVTVSLYLIETNTSEAMFIKSIDGGAQADFKFNLEPGQDYKFTTTKEGYLSSESTLSTKAYTSSTDVEVKLCITPIPKEAIVIKNIYYDTDKADIKSNTQSIIDTTLLSLLNKNPDIIIEISSHTDSRGKDDYNMKLSQKRAQSVVDYLISKGISADRLVAKGYGETLPIAPNKNTDGTDNIQGMDKNRRTEFKIIGTIPHTEIDYQE